MTKTKFIAAAAAFAIVPLTGANAADGINALIAVTQMKSSNANDNLAETADKQRDLVAEQKKTRAKHHKEDTKNFHWKKAPKK